MITNNKMMIKPPLKIKKIRDLNLSCPTGPDRPLHIAAASGLAKVGTHFYIIPDDEHHLGVFADAVSSETPGTLIRLFPGDLSNDHAERKRVKPDLEVLISFFGNLMALPSGSKSNRVKGVLISLSNSGDAVEALRELDLAPLYQNLNTVFRGELNVEGAVISGTTLKLFQRGNGQSRLNAVVDLDLEKVKEVLSDSRAFTPDLILNIHYYDLGNLNGVPLSFTDATAVGEFSILFSAVAEASPNTYEDGKCEGSVIGQMDSQGKIRAIYPLSQVIKVEGIATLKMSESLQIFLVTDGDDPSHAAELFMASLY